MTHENKEKNRDTMKVTVFGLGYVGLVTAVCFAEVGNDVMCVDINPEKIKQLKEGIIPIYEPGLDEMVKRNIEAGRLTFSQDTATGIAHGLCQFIAVDTPPQEDGSANINNVLAVAKSLGEYIDEYRVVLTKSTVPIGTTDKVKATIEAGIAARGVNCEFDTVSNPEFLKEGAAINDFMKPDRVVVGVDNPRAVPHLRELYAPFNRNHDRLIVMDTRSSELTKYAANTMLATKISLMNEIANIADRVGADIELVRQGIGSDPRIGYHFIYAGAGYGGSCFPKDVQALNYLAGEVDYDAELLAAVENVNNRQKTKLFDKLNDFFKGDLAGKTIALWGLAFKPNTDDMRAAPSRVLMEALWAAGAKVQAYDPVAMEQTALIYGERADLTLCDEPYATLDNADALVLMTEWRNFQSPDFEKIKAALNYAAIFDGRNFYSPEQLKKMGFTYYGIGRDNTAGLDLSDV